MKLSVFSKKPNTLVIALCVLSLSSCSLDRYNAVTEKTHDYRDKDPHIYGEKGKPARQTENTYPDPANGQDRADAIREKMYGKAAVVAAPAPAKTDTTKKDAKAGTMDKKAEAKK